MYRYTNGPPQPKPIRLAHLINSAHGPPLPPAGGRLSACLPVLAVECVVLRAVPWARLVVSVRCIALLLCAQSRAG